MVLSVEISLQSEVMLGDVTCVSACCQLVWIKVRSDITCVRAYVRERLVANLLVKSNLTLNNEECVNWQRECRTHLVVLLTLCYLHMTNKPET